jgi:hypothetical protein
MEYLLLAVGDVWEPEQPSGGRNRLHVQKALMEYLLLGRIETK